MLLPAGGGQAMAQGTMVTGPRYQSRLTDAFNPNTLSGDEVVSLPYTYRVG